MRSESRLFLNALAIALGIIVAGWPAHSRAQSTDAGKLTWDASKSVYNRRIRPPAAPEKINWEERVTWLLREEPGDVIITAVGDMIFNEQISRLPEADHQQLLRILQEADIAYGNLEFSINEHPEAQRPFYNFRAPAEFAWEVAAIGINLVNMANNHALDFGPEGRRRSPSTSFTSGTARSNGRRTCRSGTAAIRS